jgi:hypothetical protein
MMAPQVAKVEVGGSVVVVDVKDGAGRRAPVLLVKVTREVRMFRVIAGSSGLSARSSSLVRECIFDQRQTSAER